MYNASKLSSETKNFLQNIQLTAKSNQEVIMMALAKSIANALQMPSSPVENPSEFYLHTTFQNMRNTLSHVNELVVVDLARAQDLIKTFWLIRYNILYPRKKLFVTNAIKSESHFFGFSSLLSPTDATFIQENTLVLVTIANGFSQMIDEINIVEA